MRLVQLARKLGITQNEMIEFLQKSGAEHLNSSNAKIDEKYIVLALKHYNYIEEVEMEEEEPVSIETTEKVEKEAIIAVEEPKIEEPPLVEVIKEESRSLPTEVAEIVEVIRAKKIKLEGIKVLGKMELPEPPVKEKKEVSVDDSSTEESRPTSRKQRAPAKAKNNKNSRNHKKTETYEEKLKKQEREAARDKRKREKMLKDKKKKHYDAIAKVTKLQKVKSKVPKKQPAPNTTTPKSKVVPHSNPIVRLWQWLNGKYD